MLFLFFPSINLCRRSTEMEHSSQVLAASQTKSCEGIFVAKLQIHIVFTQLPQLLTRRFPVRMTRENACFRFWAGLQIFQACKHRVCGLHVRAHATSFRKQDVAGKQVISYEITGAAWCVAGGEDGCYEHVADSPRVFIYSDQLLSVESGRCNFGFGHPDGTAVLFRYGLGQMSVIRMGMGR